MLTVCGCSVQSSVFDIVDHRQPRGATRYRETFGEAYYDLDQHGNVDVVLRRSADGDAEDGPGTVQVIRIRSVWRSVPGRTVAHATQINATVSYHIIAGRTGATLDGAGSVFFREDRDRQTLVGTLETALLRPTRELVPGGRVFHRVELRGRFRATRDPRRVTRIVHEMDRLFGPRS